MSMQRYPEEFKSEAVKQITERGHKWPMCRPGFASASTACINGR
jgi:transposase-like protein